MNISTATPVEIDTKIAELAGELAQVQHNIERREDYIESSEARGYLFGVEEARRDLEKLQDREADLMEAITPLQSEYIKRGWTRFYLVTNTGGHVHKDTNCGTCRRTTSYAWLTEYSGTSHADLVVKAGERACSVCFAGHEGLITDRPSQLTWDVKDRETKAAEKAAKDKAAAEKAAKLAAGALLAPVQMHGRFGETIKTTRAARTTAVDRLVSLGQRDWIPNKAILPEYISDYRVLVEALAAKEGKTTQELGVELGKKAATKIRKNRREVAAYEARMAR
jgi:hypothetical protein